MPAGAAMRNLAPEAPVRALLDLQSIAFLARKRLTLLGISGERFGMHPPRPCTF